MLSSARIGTGGRHAEETLALGTRNVSTLQEHMRDIAQDPSIRVPAVRHMPRPCILAGTGLRRRSFGLSEKAEPPRCDRGCDSSPAESRPYHRGYGANVTWLRCFPIGSGNCVVWRRLLPPTDAGTADPRSGGHLRGGSRQCLKPDMVTTARKRTVMHLANLRWRLELCSFHVSCPRMPAPATFLFAGTLIGGRLSTG